MDHIQINNSLQQYSYEEIIDLIKYDEKFSSCCQIIREKQLNGNDILNLTENQVIFWRVPKWLQIKILSLKEALTDNEKSEFNAKKNYKNPTIDEFEGSYKKLGPPFQNTKTDGCQTINRKPAITPREIEIKQDQINDETLLKPTQTGNQNFIQNTSTINKSPPSISLYKPPKRTSTPQKQLQENKLEVERTNSLSMEIHKTPQEKRAYETTSTINRRSPNYFSLKKPNKSDMQQELLHKDELKIENNFAQTKEKLKLFFEENRDHEMTSTMNNSSNSLKKPNKPNNFSQSMDYKIPSQEKRSLEKKSTMNKYPPNYSSHETSNNPNMQPNLLHEDELELKSKFSQSMDYKIPSQENRVQEITSTITRYSSNSLKKPNRPNNFLPSMDFEISPEKRPLEKTSTMKNYPSNYSSHETSNNPNMQPNLLHEDELGLKSKFSQSMDYKIPFQEKRAQETTSTNNRYSSNSLKKPNKSDMQQELLHKDELKIENNFAQRKEKLKLFFEEKRTHAITSSMNNSSNSLKKPNKPNNFLQPMDFKISPEKRLLEKTSTMKRYPSNYSSHETSNNPNMQPNLLHEDELELKNKFSQSMDYIIPSQETTSPINRYSSNSLRKPNKPNNFLQSNGSEKRPLGRTLSMKKYPSNYSSHETSNNLNMQPNVLHKDELEMENNCTQMVDYVIPSQEKRRHESISTFNPSNYSSHETANKFNTNVYFNQPPLLYNNNNNTVLYENINSFFPNTQQQMSRQSFNNITDDADYVDMSKNNYNNDSYEKDVNYKNVFEETNDSSDEEDVWKNSNSTIQSNQFDSSPKKDPLLKVGILNKAPASYRTNFNRDESNKLDSFNKIDKNDSNQSLNCGFVRNTDRKGAISMLENFGDGAFLFTPPKKKTSEYYLCLTVKKNNQYFHVGIKKNHMNKIYIDGNKKNMEFDTLNDFISFYENNVLLIKAPYGTEQIYLKKSFF